MQWIGIEWKSRGEAACRGVVAMKEQQRLRAAGDEQAEVADEDFLQALE